MMMVSVTMQILVKFSIRTRLRWWCCTGTEAIATTIWWWDGLAAFVVGQQLLEVCLKDIETRVDGWVTKAVRDQAKIGESWVGIVWIVGTDVARPSNRVEHSLKL